METFVTTLGRGGLGVCTQGCSRSCTGVHDREHPGGQPFAAPFMSAGAGTVRLAALVNLSGLKGRNTMTVDDRGSGDQG